MRDQTDKLKLLLKQEKAVERVYDVDQWLATDGPASLQDCWDLQDAIHKQRSYGFYSAGSFTSRNGRQSRYKNRMFRVSGPYSDLLVKGIDSYLVLHRLVDFERHEKFRVHDPSKKMRPKFR